MENFIKIYENQFTSDDCRELVEIYSSSSEIGNRMTFIEPIKKDQHWRFARILNESQVGKKIREVYLQGLIKYTKKYKHIPEIEEDDTRTKSVAHIQRCSYFYDLEDDLLQRGLQFLVNPVVDKSPKIIKVNSSQDFDYAETTHNPLGVLTFIVFLQDGTRDIRFKYTGEIISPKAGDLLIFPSLWTHQFKIDCKEEEGQHLMIAKIAFNEGLMENIDF